MSINYIIYNYQQKVECLSLLLIVMLSRVYNTSTWVHCIINMHIFIFFV